jgi:beta-barrel assembly-enhancing protease
MNKQRQGLTRREFLALGGVSAAAVLTGCATNPVTGRNEFMLISEPGEIELDRTNSPHQFSADYGASGDESLNAYLAGVGGGVAQASHRPGMPYTFRAVNAAHVNAYAFPGGSIAVTRGMLVNLESEAALAGLMGHEIGHVCARHTARRMSKALVSQVVVSGFAAYMAVEREKYAPLAAGLGMVGAGLLLARYSRDDEREADALGIDYMVKAGHGPGGFVDLMTVLVNLSSRDPNVIELMFSTHPMSRERHEQAVARASERYASQAGLPMGREAYMDHTARVRAIKPAIEQMQKGDRLMMQNRYAQAETHYGSALKLASDDYAALVMMAKCMLAQDKPRDAERYAALAMKANPGEAQAHQVAGLARGALGQHDAALAQFEAYDGMLPGNPNLAYFKGMSLDRMGRKDDAAREYSRYLAHGPEGDYARQAHGRLVEWGYIQAAPVASGAKP